MNPQPDPDTPDLERDEGERAATEYVRDPHGLDVPYGEEWRPAE